MCTAGPNVARRRVEREQYALPRWLLRGSERLCSSALTGGLVPFLLLSRQCDHHATHPIPTQIPYTKQGRVRSDIRYEGEWRQLE